MKLRLDEIAQEMINRGHSSINFDSDDFINAVLEILAEKDLFTLIGDEIHLLEDEKRYFGGEMWLSNY